MKKTNKKKILILVLIILIVVIFAFFLFLRSSNEKLSHIETVENVISNSFLTTNTSLDKVEKITEHDLGAYYVAIGEGSFLRQTITNDIDLSKYQKVQSEYASIVEEEYLSGTSYTVEEMEDGNLSFSFRPWYFSVYESDVLVLANELLELEGIDDDLYEEDYDTYEIYAYKARVKAMVILNDYLDYYENKNEEYYFVFYFDEDEPSENQYLSLYFNLIGLSSEYMADTEEELIEQKERIEEYLEKAIETGIIDEDNPLEL